MPNDNYSNLVNQLDDQTAVSLLSQVTEKWIAESPNIAIHIVRRTEGYAQRQKLAVPAWVDDPSINSQEAGHLARKALLAMAEGDDQQISQWTRTAIAAPASSQAYAFEPVTGTLCLMGLILASRVKKIGPDKIEFYEGIPDGLAKVLKAAKSFFGIVG